MGRLVDAESGVTFELLPVTRVGRNADRDLALKDWARTSGEHATVRWGRTNWELVDQGSRNGSWVNGSRVVPGVPIPLAVGNEIVFGAGGPAFRLTDDAPPEPRATRGGEILRAWNGVLGIPDGSDLVLVRATEDGRWVAESAEGAAPVSDRSELLLGSGTWVLSLPDGALLTEVPPTPGRLTSSELRFTTYEAGDRVALDVVEADGVVHDLGCRAHHRVLWALAFLRLRSRRGGADPASEGWVTPARLAEQLEVSSPRYVYLKLFHARAQLRAAGFEDADQLVERDLARGRIRIGTARLQVLDAP